MKKLLLLASLFLLPLEAKADWLVDFLPGDNLSVINGINLCVSPGPAQIGDTCTAVNQELLYLKQDDDALAVVDTLNDETLLLLENDTNNFISFRSPNTSQAGLTFNEGTDEDAAKIYHYYTGVDYIFRFLLDGESIAFNGDPAIIVGATDTASTEKLYLKEGDDGITVSNDNTSIAVFENNSTAYLNFRVPTNLASGLSFNEGTIEGGGLFRHKYDGSDGIFEFFLGTAEIMEIGEEGLSIGGSQTSSEKLYVKVANDGVAVSNDNTSDVIIESNTTSYLNFRRPNNIPAGISFNEGTIEGGGLWRHKYDGSDGIFEFYLGTAEVLQMNEGGIMNFQGTFGDSSIDPSSTAETDWLEIELNGTQYFIPLYPAS